MRKCNPQTIFTSHASTLWSVILTTTYLSLHQHRKMNEARTKDVRKTRMHSTNACVLSSPASPYVTSRRYNASGRAWAHATVFLAPHPGTLYYYISQTGCEDPGCKYHIFPCHFWDPGWTLAGPWRDPRCNKSYFSSLRLGTLAGPWSDPGGTLDTTNPTVSQPSVIAND